MLKVNFFQYFYRGSSSLFSSLRALSSTVQLRIDSYHPAKACSWKFHKFAHAIVLLSVSWVLKFTQHILIFNTITQLTLLHDPK